VLLDAAHGYYLPNARCDEGLVRGLEIGTRSDCFVPSATSINDPPRDRVEGRDPMSGGVRTPPSTNQKNEAVGSSSTRPCGVTSQRVVKAALARQPRGEHIGRV